ncbi:MAG: PAS domain S-box protein [Desulfurivibrionaceae bacterium]
MFEKAKYEELKKRVQELEEECLARRQVESDLIEREEKYRMLYNNAPLPYHSFDENALILDVNPAWLKTFGYEREEVIEKSFFDFLPPEWQAYLEDNFPEIKQRGFFHVQQIRIRHKGGYFLDTSFDGCIDYWPDGSFRQGHCILKDITDLNQAEDRLYLTQYSIDRVNDCIFWIDDDGRFTSVNDSFCRRLGYSREELISMKVFEIDPFFPREKWLNQWQDLMKKDYLTFETVYCTKSGKMFPAEVTINSLNYRGKQYNCAIVRDISKRVQITEELNQFKYVLDNTLDMIFMFDVDTLQFVYFNRGAMESLSYTEEELLELHPYDIKPHFSEQNFRKMISPLLTGEQEVLNYETIHRSKKGREFIVEASLQLVRNPYGDRRFVAIVRDITDRKRSEEALLKAKNEWENTFDAIPDIILVQDEDMRIVRANKKAHEIFQVEFGSLNGKYCYEVFRGTNEPCIECPALSTFKEHTTHRENVTHKDLGKIFNVTSSSVPDENGDLKYVVNIVKDITEYKNLESQLLQEQKIESIGSLAGGIAHDFNNILMGLFGNISLAKSELDSSHPVFEALGEAEKAMDRATRMTHQLLTFARGGEPIKKNISLNHLVRKSVRLNLSGSNVDPVYNLDEKLWNAEADGKQMEQVLSSLILNADQAMPDGGRLYISMENVEISREEVANLKQGKYIKAIIQDEGEGINPEYIERIFDPYFTTRHTMRGLGLAIVYSIINKHGGHIKVSSEPGKGAKFTLYLPAVDSERLPESKPDEAQAVPMGRSPKILVMDDEEMVRSVSEKMLSRNGFAVETAVNGQEAIEKYRQLMDAGEVFDIVIMDLNISGGMGGKAAIKELLRLDPEARAVISSGFAEDPLMANYEEYGFMDVVEKPFNMKQLIDAMQRVLKR